MRLIDADKLIETAKKDIDHWSIKSRGSGKTETSTIKTMLALGAIEYVEQAQTVQRKRGNWIELSKLREFYTVECSECKNRFHFDTRYCPNCGSVME